MTLTWLQATIYPRVKRCRIVRGDGSEVLGENENFSSLRNALVEARPEPGQSTKPTGLIVELWDASACLARVCPEPGIILVGTRVEKALADRGIQCAFWLAKWGFRETLTRIEAREMMLLEAARTVLTHRLLLEKDAAGLRWREAAPDGLQALWSLFARRERESASPLSVEEFDLLLAAELERSLPSPLERARALLIWLGRAYHKDDQLLAPHLIAAVLFRLPDQLTLLTQHQNDPEVSRGFTVLLRSASTSLTKSQRRLRKALIAYLNL